MGSPLVILRGLGSSEWPSNLAHEVRGRYPVGFMAEIEPSLNGLKCDLALLI